MLPLTVKAESIKTKSNACTQGDYIELNEGHNQTCRTSHAKNS